jgi:lanthionine synthetase-like protein
MGVSTVTLIRLSAALFVLSSAHVADATASGRVHDRGAVAVVRMAADSLIARHRAMPQGGWAWRSAIQAPHYQTDRDVGAASIGEGLLAAFAVTHDSRYRRAAVAAGDYLLGVAEPAAGGLRWPDWADPSGRRSTTHFTSFDDGAAGISDYLWRLFEVTHERRFRTAALDGMRWVIAQAEGAACPQSVCSWRWTDDPSWRVAYSGVGMGQAGIVLALDAFADRTGNPTFRAYARAGAAQLRTITSDGARPLPKGSADDTAETGFLSGSAGAAQMFFERYRHDRDRLDLVTARRLLDWVNAQAVADRSGGLRWPRASDDGSSTSGFELGAAGIAWVNLQAAGATSDAGYLEVARRAGVRLRHVATAGDGWRESPADASSAVHVGLDSGTAGIGWVLEDLARAGVERDDNGGVARSALAWLRAGATRDRHGVFWYESRSGGRPRLRAEPSWHWGAAGIAAFAARLAGWTGRSPGGLPAG